jgi:hypothetical protein
MLRINVITLLKWSTQSLSGPIGPTFLKVNFTKGISKYKYLKIPIYAR